MESYGNLESQFQLLDQDIFSATDPQTFLSQPGAPHGPSPGFHAPEFRSQTRAYVPRSYGYPLSKEALKNFPRSFPLQAHDTGRPVNIVLPNGGTDAQILLILFRVERLERELGELKELSRDVVRAQEDIKATLESVKDGLNNFVSSITIAELQRGETPSEVPGGAAETI
ncbi:hypothetical protein N658DRAFT_501084 [Parathielavia hyrcaniae]|uniref:Uncharacterized protein n=1 Tax=Parathielavia hyrcaniae TaxID=113614 RepID=A0AAN6PS24_9PEZI|nr:hypothetical protein N658DRAFT_501084 [Parathielavia hyrcaniae]